MDNHKSQKKVSGALITGASDRIGRKIALTLAGLGYNIALHYHQAKERAIETRGLILKTGVDCTLVQADFSIQAEVDGIIPQVVRSFPLEILVNNASEFKKSSFLERGIELFEENLQINLKAPYTLIKSLRENADQGLVINILDTGISQNKTEYFDYLLTKKMLRTLTELAAYHLAPNFRVNALAPGLILPPVGKGNSYLQELAQTIPAGQIGSLEQIGSCIRFLVENEFVTGETIFIDGGENLGKIKRQSSGN